MTATTLTATPTLPYAADADLRHDDSHFTPCGDIHAISLGAEIVGVDSTGTWMYVRVGKDISRRNTHTWTVGRWECYATRWDEHKAFVL